MGENVDAHRLPRTPGHILGAGGIEAREELSMPLTEIDADWLKLMQFNGMESPINGSGDTDSSCVVIEALLEAPEASRK